MEGGYSKNGSPPFSRLHAITVNFSFISLERISQSNIVSYGFHRIHDFQLFAAQPRTRRNQAAPAFTLG
jgi:hypothetical protein